MKVLIYTDNVSVNHVLYYSLGKLCGKENVFFVNANEILDGVLDEGVDLFVMPGGASRYKSAKLDGQATKMIKAYLDAGGRYLGICAGAYMACETTYWAQGEPYEITVDNQLALCSAKAHGPITAYGAGDNYNGTVPKVVSLRMDKHVTSSLYIGGCWFELPDNNDCNVVARFDELPHQPPAVISGSFGEGKWLLSSTHPEYDKEALDLLDFDVIGNDHKSYSAVRSKQVLTLDFFEALLEQLLK